MEKCPHCGLVHETTCARIKAIEYQPDGVTVKRIEFHGPVGDATPTTWESNDRWLPSTKHLGIE